MRSPWKTQLASDVIRDGLGLELLDDDENILAEVFRCDADLTVTLSIFEPSLSQQLIEELVADARDCLGTFEDGTPLPKTFERRRV